MHIFAHLSLNIQSTRTHTHCVRALELRILCDGSSHSRTCVRAKSTRARAHELKDIFNENLIYTHSGLHTTQHSICLLACVSALFIFHFTIWHEKRAQGSHFIFVAFLLYFIAFSSLCSWCCFLCHHHHFTFAVHSHKCTLKLISRSLSDGKYLHELRGPWNRHNTYIHYIQYCFCAFYCMFRNWYSCSSKACDVPNVMARNSQLSNRKWPERNGFIFSLE